jgi:hypothetical protein
LLDDAISEAGRQLVRFAVEMPVSDAEMPSPTDGIAPDIARIRVIFSRGVGASALRTLATAGFSDLDLLDGASIPRLQSLHGMGPKAPGILRDAQVMRGKALRQ